jgi:competence protein ComEA
VSNGKKSAPAGPIDVNRATPEELQQLPGVGPVMSRRIVAARDVAPFKSVDDLRRVSGIGAKTLEKLRPLVTVSTPDDPTGPVPN